jgi:cell division septation protein DedD
MPSHRPRLRRRWTVAALLGAGAGSLLLASPAQAASAVGGSISPDEVIQRAQSWVTEKVPYNQGGYHTDANGTYREDCSGFVSMAWHLPTSMVTSTLPSVSTKISTSQLQPGDALDYTADHVILFGNWIDKSAGTFNYYSEQNSRVLTNKYQGDLNASSVAGWPTSDYTPLRYDKITGSPSATTSTPAPAAAATSTTSTAAPAPAPKPAAAPKAAPAPTHYRHWNPWW